MRYTMSFSPAAMIDERLRATRHMLYMLPLMPLMPLYFSYALRCGGARHARLSSSFAIFDAAALPFAFFLRYFSAIAAIFLSITPLPHIVIARLLPLTLTRQ